MSHSQLAAKVRCKALSWGLLSLGLRPHCHLVSCHHAGDAKNALQCLHKCQAVELQPWDTGRRFAVIRMPTTCARAELKALACAHYTA